MVRIPFFAYDTFSYKLNVLLSSSKQSLCPCQAYVQ
jgi:hypothetical protein